MQLQQIGLIERARGLPYTTYQLAAGLDDLCIKEPSLLRVSDQEEAAAISELERWKKGGLHDGLFFQLSGPHRDSWM